MAKAITKKIKSTTVHAVKLDEAGSPVDVEVVFPRTFRSDEAAAKAARKSEGEIIVKSIEVVEASYSMSLDDFLAHAVKVAEGETAEGAEGTEGEAAEGN